MSLIWRGEPRGEDPPPRLAGVWITAGEWLEFVRLRLEAARRPREAR